MIEDSELYAGRALGQYELLLPLAQGATASVWAARTRGSALEKIVAVKAMLTEFSADPDSEAMFLDEARIVARIRHPNVATVLDLGEEDDALYIVMEWVEGEPLQVLMREARAWDGIPMPLAVRIVKLAAAGLHAAHELCDEAGSPLHLVHRDVSPHNILVGYDGSVKVIDFGVAKAASNMSRTNIGQIKGKVAYMAPEQMLGDSVDRRTDVFALGAVLYQLVTGKHPYRGDNEFATMARLRDPAPFDAPSKIVKVSAELEQVIMKALAKDRDKRIGSMLEFSRALDKAVPSGPEEARVLGELVRTLLAQRAAKKNQAIRDALKAAGHDTRPVNLSTIFDEAATRPSAPPPPLPAPRKPAAAPARGAPAREYSEAELLIPGLDQQRQRQKLIAAAITIALAIAIGLWAIFGGKSGSAGDSGSTIKRAF